MTVTEYVDTVGLIPELKWYSIVNGPAAIRAPAVFQAGACTSREGERLEQPRTKDRRYDEARPTASDLVVNPSKPVRILSCFLDHDRPCSIEWAHVITLGRSQEALPMDVEIVIFPETKVAAIEHHGSPALEHETVRKLVAWKLEKRLLDQSKYRSYGLHYTDSRNTPPSEHHVDFCLPLKKMLVPILMGSRQG